MEMNFKPNTLFTRDNLYILRGMNDQCIDLIYLDPPFNSKRNYSAPLPMHKDEHASFSDVWKLTDIDEALHEEMQVYSPALYEIIKGVELSHSKGMFAYLVWMSVRLKEMHRVLKDTGSIYLHCDQTASHYLRIVMDAIFGGSKFRNEVAWCYKSGGASKKQWAKKHDTLLFYSKGEKWLFNEQKEVSYNREYKPYRFKGVEEYQDDEGRWYTLVNAKDYWNIDMVGRTSGERTGYPTQKPLALLERIVKASSNEGDIVLDPFCGCATALVAAEKHGRKWVGIDISPTARALIKHRMENEIKNGKKVEIIRIREITGRVIPDQLNKKRWEHVQEMYEKQEGVCNGCKCWYRKKDLAVDHTIPRSKGGQDTPDNMQLLCTDCNSRKGSGSMETLWQRLRQVGILEEHEGR